MRFALNFCISTKKRRSVMGALKMLGTKLIATIALTLLIGSTLAIAQTKGAGSRAQQIRQFLRPRLVIANHAPIRCPRRKLRKIRMISWRRKTPFSTAKWRAFAGVAKAAPTVMARAFFSVLRAVYDPECSLLFVATN
jgi:hypothetical protein